MKKTLLTLAVICTTGFIVNLAASPPATAAELKAPAETITIEGRKPARFNHATHTALGLDCGACHHDAKHQPLTEANIGALANGDSLRCGGCHKADFANEKLRKPMDLFHARCKSCHTAGVNGKTGPTGCNDCHVKAKAKNGQ
ncbi:cytochrome c3 family protein [Thiovibrio sp. JS02]